MGATQVVEGGHQRDLFGLQGSNLLVHLTQMRDNRLRGGHFICDISHTIDHSFESRDTTA
ncbi:hypothetical protein ACFXHA_07530 [Nocardia sp. NPDC059240]|uniref:hypothetical protein n=1 Tax=Nocardia sp. NPDC059240 TaxID=3346786 RepID=UPI00368FC7D2